MPSATNRELLRNAPKHAKNRLLPIENKPTPLLPSTPFTADFAAPFLEPAA